MKKTLTVALLTLAMSTIGCSTNGGQYVTGPFRSVLSSYNIESGEKPLKGKDLTPDQKDALSKDKIKWNDANKENNKNKSFLYEIDGTLKRGKGLETISYEGKDSGSLNPEKSLVYFEDNATPQDIDRFLKDFNATITEKISEKANIFYVAFDFSKIKIDNEKFKKMCEASDVKGNYKYSSESVAKLIYQVYSALQSKSEYQLNHIGISYDLALSDDGTYTEGIDPYGTQVQTPSSKFWYHRIFDNYGIHGNDINDTYFSSYQYSVGYPVKVAVIDSEFIVPGENVYANDSESYRVYGFNSSRTVYDMYTNQYKLPTPGSVAGHGRRVASVIFSAHNDSRGTAGLAPYAQPVLINASQFDSAQRVNAISKACDLGAKIINCSWSVPSNQWSGSPETWALKTAINRAYNEQRIVVCSSGNTGDYVRYPAHYSNVIGVSGHNSSGYTTYVNGVTCNNLSQDIYAAGTDMVLASNAAYPNVGVYYESGTSYSAPLVAATIALYVAQGKVSNKDTALSKLQSEAWVKTMGGYTRRYLDVTYGLVQ